jgi:hypothetical protein
MSHLSDYLQLATLIIALASAISATFGLHKTDGVLGKIGKVINVLALNLNHAAPKSTTRDPPI